MKILAVDTATRSCSVALTEDGRLMTEMTTTREETHSRHLLGMIDAVLRTVGWATADLDGFAVTRGPGSFTGLRIGISTIKGMASASGKPVAGVSGLEALASQFPFSTYPICTIMDARKGEVYSALFRTTGGGVAEITGERVSSPADAVSGIDRPCLLVGDGASLYRKLIADRLRDLALFAPAGFHPVRASRVAFLAEPRIKAGEADTSGAFSPHYIRESDAALPAGKKK